MNEHKKWVSEAFDRASGEYGKGSGSFFTYFGKRLVEQVEIVPGQQVLDVATGRGAVLFPAAVAVGPSGKVVGIDISQQMLKETSNEAIQRNIHWVELQYMDAEHLTFPDHSFDFVFCGFSIFFFPSVPTAMSEFKRVLKPGGRLVVSTWGNDSELDAEMNVEAKKLCNYKSLNATPIRSERELRKFLEKAGFSAIQIVQETKIFSHTSAEDWWDSLWARGTRVKFEQLSSDQVATLRTKILKKVNSMDKGNGIAEERQAFYGIAQKN